MLVLETVCQNSYPAILHFLRVAVRKYRNSCTRGIDHSCKAYARILAASQEDFPGNYRYRW
jgi:hypothetical protein